MGFQSPWSKIPLRARWVVCLLFGALLIALLAVFVNHNSGDSLVRVSAKNLRVEARQADVVIGQEQAPVIVHIPAHASVTRTLAASVRRDMNRQITSATVDGPLQRVSCLVHGGTLQRTGYHCVAEAEDVNYFFVAVVTPRAHRGDLCEKVIPPTPSENIPVVAGCRAPS